MTGRRVHRGTAPAAAPPGYGAGLVTQVRADVLSGDTAVTGAALAQAVRASGRLLGAEGALRAVDRVRADLQGLGPLQPLLALPGLTDILVNGPEEVWTDTGQGL